MIETLTSLTIILENLTKFRLALEHNICTYCTGMYSLSYDTKEPCGLFSKADRLFIRTKNSLYRKICKKWNQEMKKVDRNQESVHLLVSGNQCLSGRDLIIEILSQSAVSLNILIEIAECMCEEEKT